MVQLSMLIDASLAVVTPKAHLVLQGAKEKE
jgi:hypothetical protein